MCDWHDVASPSAYEPRTPSQCVLYQLVRDHFETFRKQAAGLRDGEGLRRFVEQTAFERSAPASLAEALAEAGVSRVPPLRLPGGRVRSLPLRRLWHRPACPVLVQGPSVLSEMRGASNGGTRRASGRPHLPGGAGSPVGRDVAPSPALPSRMGSRPVPIGGRCRRACHSRLPAPRRPRGRDCGRARRRGHHRPALWRCDESQRPHARARRRWGLCERWCGRPLLAHPVLQDLDVAEVLATIVPRVRRLPERRGLGDDDGGCSRPG
jgi:hypothetical protein